MNHWLSTVQLYWIFWHHTGVFSPSSATYCSKSFWNLLSTTFCLHFFSQNGPGVYYRIYYRRIGVDEERDFQQQTLKQLGTISRGFYVVKIQKKYYWTQYEVKVQVFNDLCLDHNCTVAPVSNTTSCAKNVTSLDHKVPSGHDHIDGKEDPNKENHGCIIYSAEDLPQVAPTRVCTIIFSES